MADEKGGVANVPRLLVETRTGTDRRRHDDGRPPQGGRNRRHGDRRRAKFRNAVLTSLAIAVPPQINLDLLRDAIPSVTSRIESEGTVTSSIDEVKPLLPSRRVFEPYVNEAADKYDVDPALIRAVMQAESAFNPYAVSRAGAQGLMQLMPALSDELGVTDPFDPRQNIMAGARYLRQLLDMHDGNIRLAVASYNAGPGAVARYGGIPPYKETRNYVVKVTDLLKGSRKRNGSG